MGLNVKQADRCKNFFALGMMYWLYNRRSTPTESWIEGKFKAPEISEANLEGLQAGFTPTPTRSSCSRTPTRCPRAELARGPTATSRATQALAIGLATRPTWRAARCSTAATRSPRPATSCTQLARRTRTTAWTTFQAEDEIAAVCAAIGASYGGSIGVTGTSGPGLALKSEALGLAVMTELPLVVSTCSAAARPPVCPPRPSRPTC